MKLPDFISKLQSIIHQLYQEINELETKNSFLVEENKELQAQLKQNSQNSSKSTSTDGYKKAPAFPGKKGDTKGGRKGHEDNTLLQVKNPDIIKEHEVERCTCDKDLPNSPFPVVETRQVFDLPEPRLMVTSHQIHQTRCPERGRVHKADATRGLNTPVQHGNGAKALVTLLNTGYKLPFKKIQMLFTGLFGYSINESTIKPANQTCYEKLEKTEKTIVTEMTKSHVAHAGKTGSRAKGRNLLERLVKHEDALLAFAFESEVPFTNNQAERDVRLVKVKQEIPGCSRAFTGAEIYARVEGFISSARENQLDIFKEPRDTFNGYNYFIPANE